MSALLPPLSRHASSKPQANGAPNRSSCEQHGGGLGGGCHRHCRSSGTRSPSPSLVRRSFGSPARGTVNQPQQLQRTPPRSALQSPVPSRTGSGQASPHLTAARARSFSLAEELDDAAAVAASAASRSLTSTPLRRSLNFADAGAPNEGKHRSRGGSKGASLPGLDPFSNLQILSERGGEWHNDEDPKEDDPLPAPAAALAAPAAFKAEVTAEQSHEGYSSDSTLDEADAAILKGEDDIDELEDVAAAQRDAAQLSWQKELQPPQSRLKARRNSVGHVSRVSVPPPAKLPPLDIARATSNSMLPPLQMQQLHPSQLPPTDHPPAAKHGRRRDRGTVTRETPRPDSSASTICSISNSPNFPRRTLGRRESATGDMSSGGNTTSSTVVNSVAVSRASSPSRDSMRGLDPLRRQLAAAGVATTNNRRMSFGQGSAASSPFFGPMVPPSRAISSEADSMMLHELPLPALSLGPGLSIPNSRRNSSVDIRAAAAAEILSGDCHAEPAVVRRRRGSSLLSHSRRDSLAPLVPPELISAAAAAEAAAAVSAAAATATAERDRLAASTHAVAADVPVVLVADGPGDNCAVRAPRRRKQSHFSSQQMMDAVVLHATGGTTERTTASKQQEIGETHATEQVLRARAYGAPQLDNAETEPSVAASKPSPSTAAPTSSVAAAQFAPPPLVRSRRSSIVGELQLAQSSQDFAITSPVAPSSCSSSGSVRSNPFSTSPLMSPAELQAAERRKTMHLAELLGGIGMENLSTMLRDEDAMASHATVAAAVAQACQADKAAQVLGVPPSEKAQQLLGMIPPRNRRSRAPSPERAAPAASVTTVQDELSPSSQAMLERAEAGKRSKQHSPMLQPVRA